MLLVDTNVLVALFVRDTPWFAQARTLHERDRDWRTESHALVELSSALTRLVRIGEVEIGSALEVLDRAQRRFDQGLLLAPHAEALKVALTRGVSAYDARFLVAAMHLGTRLTTEDVKLRAAAPDLTQSIAQALAG
ncbi:MAG: type II toxin-antitoxin system VapC family toxin [Nevskia sp.]|nr:type II toxin-antitoxin system VapC family toxin [Nevskia sp.]